MRYWLGSGGVSRVWTRFIYAEGSISGHFKSLYAVFAWVHRALPQTVRPLRQACGFSIIVLLTDNLTFSFNSESKRRMFLNAGKSFPFWLQLHRRDSDCGAWNHNIYLGKGSFTIWLSHCLLQRKPLDGVEFNPGEFCWGVSVCFRYFFARRILINKPSGIARDKINI